MYDIIVIGAGPAGMTAAIYARRAAKTVLVLEALSYGGQIINTPDIENYPAAAHVSGFDFATGVYNQAKELGAEFKFEKALEIENRAEDKLVRTKKNEYAARAVIIATGSENRKLGVENEDKLVGRGISYCATCDGAFYRKKKVAVVGGGNTALEDALYLAEVAEKVYLIHRRDSFRGEEATAALLRERENVELVLNSTVKQLHFEKKLNAVTVAGKSGAERTLEVDGLFVAVGRIPENQNFASVIELDGSGYAVAGEDCRTKTEGIFVAGDNRQKEVRQLVTAAADGAVAATAAVNYINSK
ncbi:NAD(P)/FAD-dependent oxidoreductase [Ruminococcus difficilis]|uniref:FAD-dependent oxidoreductase n=1 Tax=Ruminococcus difficilis TaxID=2763069 RepID=A0A934WSX1_9FIRM|nr:FAD-dependent oxidoreductase [Ruminococcus difficilis]MBK6089347.1 FAD-dependent oxidoreductase [Ruminococcus difficilis]